MSTTSLDGDDRRLAPWEIPVHVGPLSEARSILEYAVDAARMGMFLSGLPMRDERVSKPGTKRKPHWMKRGYFKGSNAARRTQRGGNPARAKMGRRR